PGRLRGVRRAARVALAAVAADPRRRAHALRRVADRRRRGAVPRPLRHEPARNVPRAPRRAPHARRQRPRLARLRPRVAAGHRLRDRRAGGAVGRAATASAPLAVLGWLAAVGGLAAWYQIVSGYLVPLYSRLGRASSWSVYRWHAWIPLGLGVLVSLASVTRRRGVSARHVVAALGLAYGLAHYVVQGKGW